MAKVIKYNLCARANHGTEDNPNYKEVLYAVSMPYNESNLAIAEKEAYNGINIIEEDGKEYISEISRLDKLEAQIFYTAMMTDTLTEV